MSGATLRLHLSTVEAELAFDGAPRAREVLASVWAAAAAPLVPPTERVRYAVIARADGGFEVRTAAGAVRSLPREQDVAPFLEAVLYEDVLHASRVAGLAVLHASAFVLDGRTVLVVGDSGAGKTALARAALARGAVHLGDEHVVTDGRALWGLPRALHLDPLPADAPSPPWHAGADERTYTFISTAGLPMRLPLVHVPEHARPRAPAPLEGAVVVLARHAPVDRYAPLERSAQLEALDRALLVAPPAVAAALAGLPAGLALRWASPERALDALRGQLGGASGVVAPHDERG